MDIARGTVKVTALVGSPGSSVTGPDGVSVTEPTLLVTLGQVTVAKPLPTGKPPAPLDLNDTTIQIRVLDPAAFSRFVVGQQYRLYLDPA